MRRLYLSDCTPGDVLEDVYVITNKQLSATTTGKHFIKAFISDRSGQVTARMWNANRDLFNAMPESGFLRIRGRVENYQNNLQFIIEQMWPAKEGTFDVSDLMPHTSRDIDQMCQRLFDLCATIQNKHLRALVQAYLDDEDLMNDFCRAPAAMNFHHAFIGGLLEHTVNAMEVADAICKFYTGLSRDLVVAGVFLHDIAKTWELTYDASFGYSDGGQLVGHIVKAAVWVERKAEQAANVLNEEIPQPLIDVLQHIILSHHGLPEFGAARTPSTPEAIAVHVIENLDAKLMMALAVTRGPTMAGGEGNWTEYLKAFSGRLYRPDVTIAPVVIEEEPRAEGAGLPAANAQGQPQGPVQPHGPGQQQGSGQQHAPGPQHSSGQQHSPGQQHDSRHQHGPGRQQGPGQPTGPRGDQRSPMQGHERNGPRPAQSSPLPTGGSGGAPPMPSSPAGPPNRNQQDKPPQPVGAPSLPASSNKPLPPGKIAINNPLFENNQTRKS